MDVWDARRGRQRGNVSPMNTVWVLGDQLTFEGAAFADARPDTHRVLMVESTAKLHEKRWHRQRAHFILSAMRHFAQECRDRGFHVDYRQAPTLAAGLQAHIDEFAPDAVVAMEHETQAVEAGSASALRTGDVFKEISAIAQRSAELAQTIAASAAASRTRAGSVTPPS